MKKNGLKIAGNAQENSDKQKDDIACALIKALDMLIAYANASGMGVAARAMTTAKENIVYWAAELNFYESGQDKFINHHMLGNNVASTLVLMAHLENHNTGGILGKVLATLQGNTAQI